MPWARAASELIDGWDSRARIIELAEAAKPLASLVEGFTGADEAMIAVSVAELRILAEALRQHRRLV